MIEWLLHGQQAVFVAKGILLPKVMGGINMGQVFFARNACRLVLVVVGPLGQVKAGVFCVGDKPPGQRRAAGAVAGYAAGTGVNLQLCMGMAEIMRRIPACLFNNRIRPCGPFQCRMAGIHQCQYKAEEEDCCADMPFQGGKDNRIAFRDGRGTGRRLLFPL
jgi:hypothetical protein